MSASHVFPIGTVADFLNAVFDRRDAMLLAYRSRYGEAVFRQVRTEAATARRALDAMPILLKLPSGNANRPLFVTAEMSEYGLNIRDDGTFSLPYADCAPDRVWHGFVIEPQEAPQP